MKKVIKFSWKKKILGQDVEGCEYFTPYSYEALQDILPLKEYVCKSDTGLESDEYKDVKSIVEVEDDEVTNAPSDIYAPSKYDYNSDANVVISLYEANGIFSEKLQELSARERISRELMFRAKIDLSVLFNTDCMINDESCGRIREYYKRKGVRVGIANYQNKTHRYFLQSKPQYRYLYEINNLFNLGYEQNRLMELIADKQEFEREKPTICDKIIDNVTNILSDPEFKDYKILRDWLYRNKTFNKITKRHRLHEDGCFAIMQEGAKTYFAFSGIYDYEIDNKFNNCKKIAAEILSRLCGVKCCDVDVLKIVNGYQWVHLNDDNLSYLDMSQEYNSNNITYVDIPNVKSLAECLAADCRGWEDFKSTKGRYYSCCERKLLAHSVNDAEKIFYVRWEPCKACIPAFFYTKGIKTVYSFSKNADEYRENKHIDKLSTQVFSSV